MRQGDVATIADTSITIVHGADVPRALAWLQGAVVFDATPLSEAIRDLDRMYDLDIVVADTALAATRITTSVGPEPVDDVLASVAYAVGARYRRTGRRVVIWRQAGGDDRHPNRPVPDLQTASRRAGGT